jgi:hypothetical protein
MSTDGDKDENNPTLNQAAPPAPDPIAPMRKPNGQYCLGVSGNPRGRPKKVERSWSRRQRNSDILEEANRMVAVRQNGKTEFITMEQAMIRQLLIRGCTNNRAAKLARDMIDKAQSGYESRNEKFFQELEWFEANHDTSISIGGEDRAIEIRNEMRRKSKKR